MIPVQVRIWLVSVAVEPPPFFSASRVVVGGVLGPVAGNPNSWHLSVRVLYVFLLFRRRRVVIRMGFWRFRRSWMSVLQKMRPDQPHVPGGQPERALINSAPEATCAARSRFRAPTGPPRLPRGVLAARKWTRECPTTLSLLPHSGRRSAVRDGTSKSGRLDQRGRSVVMHRNRASA